LPDTGTLQLYRRPGGPGVRVDDGYDQGLEVPVFYDSLLSKLIVSAADREEAIRRMVRAIEEYEVTGVRTTLGFGKWAVQHPAFREGKFNTHFIEKYFSPEALEATDEKEAEAAALLAAVQWGAQKNSTVPAPSPEAASSPWKQRRKKG
jgi:acetyl-CoA carboxylase biotin carboxylase subunit